MKQTTASEAHGPIVQFLAAVALAVIVYIATLQVSADETTVGGFMSFMVAMLLLSAPLKRLSSVTVHLQRGLAAAHQSSHCLIGISNVTPAPWKSSVPGGQSASKMSPGLSKQQRRRWKAST